MLSDTLKQIRFIEKLFASPDTKRRKEMARKFKKDVEALYGRREKERKPRGTYDESNANYPANKRVEKS